MTTKLDQMMTYGTGLRDYMLLRDKEKVLYLQYHKSYEHQMWQDSTLKTIKLKVVEVILLKTIKFMCPWRFVQRNGYL